MARYLLDSDIVVDLLKGTPSAVNRMNALDEQEHLLCLCDIVIAEVMSGVHDDDRNDAEGLLRSFAFLESTADIGPQAGIRRYSYAREGTFLSVADAIIAATALEYDATLVSRNTRHFPMPELRVTTPGIASERG
ncbi:MAG TPA: PIN domain-containing protein [Thermomicrobiales bacterium]|nr:PIN domain-containing protein [Thermomicrobiales bacterium]